MKNTDFMNLSLPEGADKIDVEILNNDFKKLESEASKHYIKQQIEVDGTATIIGSIGPYVQLENLTDNILNVSIGDELIVLMKGDNRKIRTVSGENYGVVTNGAVRITYYINAQTYADENFYKKEKVDELLQNVEATVEVDAELSETSENPVQNKVITAELANYATTAEVESKVTEKVAEIVAGAPEDFDTLKELSDWLNQHEDSAASMNSAIQKNASDIETANSAIQKNTNDISSKLTYGQITVHVDSVNGSDDNAGTSSVLAVKTLKKAADISYKWQDIYIRLANGEYAVDWEWQIYNQEIHLVGETTDNVVVNLSKTIRLNNSYLDFARGTIDSSLSTNENPIIARYGTVMRVKNVNFITQKQTCMQVIYDSQVYFNECTFAGATHKPITAEYNSVVEVINCINNTGKYLFLRNGSELHIWGNEWLYDRIANGGKVYKDGIQVYPVDVSALLARIEALETATSTTTEGGE